MAFTPGPWKMIEVAHTIGIVPQKRPKGITTRDVEDICTIEVYNDQHDAKANARLISAAPDLLEALQVVLSVADRKTVEFDKARAAIAKATGE